MKKTRARDGLRAKGKQTAPAATKQDYFIGKWFHSMGADGDLGWQGQIVQSLPDAQSYMVQLYSWLDGGQTIVRRVDLAGMDGWRIYETNQEMLDYSEYFHKHIRPVVDRDQR